MNWVLDLDGVVYRGRAAVPGSPQAVERLQRAGQPVWFVTNNSWSTTEQVEQKLAAMGIEANGRVYSSAIAAGRLLSEEERVLVLGGPGICRAVERAGAVVVEADPDVVMVGLDKDLSYPRLAAAVAGVLGGARFIATNTDRTFPAANDQLLPGAGALVAAVSAATGVEPVVAGKPHDPAVEGFLSQTSGPGIMVGDRPETDGLFASALGYQFGLVLSGATTTVDLPVEPDPSYTAADLATLVDLVLDAR